MQMQNMRVTITPLCIYYCSNKPLTIILKLKRILISTNYELEKFECKKQFTLKNNMVDFSVGGLGQGFGFRISKELQLANTKVDFMVFALMNKDVKLLGIGTLDLGIFQHVDNTKLPIQQELKINLIRSEDPHAYITTRLTLQKLTQPDNKNNTTRVQSDGMNSLKTQSYNRESLLIGRRKQYDVPTGYEISKKNYKQVQVVRNNEQRSRSKSAKQAGSYKKRFQYQNNRSVVLKQGQDQPQVPPSQFPQTKGQSKGSPVPRLKTPEPVSDFQMSSTSSIQKKLKKKERQSPKNESQSKPDEINPKNSRNKIKIVVDVYQEHKVIEQTGYYDNDQDIEVPREYVDRRQKQTYRRQHKETKIQKNSEKEDYQYKSSKNIKSESQIGKISHVHYQNKDKQKETEQNVQDHRTRNPQKKFNQKIDSPQHQSSIQFQQRVPDDKLTYQNYRHSQSLQNNQNKPNKNNTNTQNKNNQSLNLNPSDKRPSIVHNRKEIEPKTTKQQKQKSRQTSENKFKSITDKLELIQHKIKEGKKSQSASSPTQNKESSQNTFYHHNESDEKNSFGTNKPYSPYTTKDKDNNGRVQNKKSDKEENLSANTFKENYFESQHESSPGKNNTSINHINSFDPMSQSQKKPHGQSSSALDSIAEETANLSHNSDSNMKFSQKPAQIPDKNQNRRQDGLSNRQNGKTEAETQKKQPKKQVIKKIPQSQEEPSVYQSSVANFSINQKDQSSKRQEPKKQSKQNVSDNIKTSKQLQNKSENVGEQPNKKKEEEPKNSSSQIKKVYTFKQQEKSNESIQQPQNFYPLSRQKKPKRINNNIILQVDLKIEPTIEPKKPIKQPQNKTDSLKKLENDPKLHKGCEQKITNLENLLDHQEQNHRKEMMQKDLEYRTLLKNQIAKSLSAQQEELKSLRAENSKLKQRQLEYNKNRGSLNKNQSKQSVSSPQEVSRLKDQNLRLRNLLDKLNAELEQSDQKHFEALTAVQKKDLEYRRKIDDYGKINAQLQEKLQKRELQIKEQNEKIQKMQTQAQSKKQEQVPSNIIQSEKQIKQDASATNVKSYQEQYLAQKKKSVNLQGQLREKCNQIRFLKIKNDNLLQEKKDLQNEIDNIAINNKLEMAKQGSIAKMNLQAASVTNSVKVENRALRQEINSLQKQVHELNGLLQGIIIEGNLTEQRLSQNKEMSEKQNGQNLERKYKALQKKAQAYEQEIRQKQLKIAEIINAIFSYGNPKLMDQISKLVGMTQE